METKYIWRLVLIFGLIAIVGIGYIINDIYLKPYWEDRCLEEKVSAAQNASIMTVNSIIIDYCSDNLIDYTNEDGTTEEITMEELCRRKG